MNKREEQKERRRAEILNVALDLFSKRGYGATRVADIVAESQISMGLLFHYFKTKEALYHELIKTGCEHTYFPLPQDNSPIDTFSKTAAGILNFIDKNPMAVRMFVFMANAVHDDSIPKESKELLLKMDVVTRSLPVIEKGQQLGEIRQGDARSLSAAFWGAIIGIAQEMSLNPGIPCPDPEWVIAILKNNRTEQGV
jgi:TetR/AcrR family transcriptional regulator